MEIPEYYLNSQIFLNMTENLTFKNSSKEEIFGLIRDDSKIINLKDFIFTLSCLSYWLIEKLPKIVIDYIDCNLNLNYKDVFDKNEHILKEYFRLVNDRINYKKGFKFFSCAKNYYVGHKNDGTATVFFVNSKKTCELKGKFKKIVSKDDYSICLRENGEFYVFGKFSNKKINRTLRVPDGKFIDFSLGHDYVVAQKENGNFMKFDHHSKNDIEGDFLKIMCTEKRAIGIKNDFSLEVIDTLHYPFVGISAFVVYDVCKELPEGKFTDIFIGGTDFFLNKNGDIKYQNYYKGGEIYGKFKKIISNSSFSVALNENKEAYFFPCSYGFTIFYNTEGVYGSSGYMLLIQNVRNLEGFYKKKMRFYNTYTQSIITEFEYNEDYVDFFCGRTYCLCLKKNGRFDLLNQFDIFNSNQI